MTDGFQLIGGHSTSRLVEKRERGLMRRMKRERGGEGDREATQLKTVSEGQLARDRHTTPCVLTPLFERSGRIPTSDLLRHRG